MAVIEDIAGRHLGKTTHYETPTGVDPSLLVAIPRILNREAYGINDDLFVGFDTWNAYEVSFLSHLDRPVTCIAKIIVPSNSESIVESKSLKLYLNSYNMASFDSVERVERQISEDLRKLLNAVVVVRLFRADRDYVPVPPIQHMPTFTSIDMPFEGVMKFTHFSENAVLLDSNFGMYDLDVERDYFFRSACLRSNCRVTNQPDWGDVYIHIRSKTRIVPIMIYEYLASFRNENHFHEEVCEVIYKRLHDHYAPSDLMVACMYTRRGGIDINPVRASSGLVLQMAGGLADPSHLVRKTNRQ